MARICVEWMTCFASTYRRLWGFTAPPSHDPVAVARVIDPAIVRCVDANVVIETAGEWTTGATVVDLHHYTGRPATARVGIELETSGVLDQTRRRDNPDRLTHGSRDALPKAY